MLNISNDLCTKLKQRINTQRTFDQQPLTKRICWQCGRVLWGEGSCKATYIIDPPKGMQAKDAPANAFLTSVDNCFLTFEHESKKRKWYSCAYCKTNRMPAELYVGDVLDTSESMNMKPVKLWDMRKPQPIAKLSNRYETGHVSLCGLFSTTVKKASVSQYQHTIGEVNSITKLDRHFHGMFGFLAVKEDDINVFADNPDSASRIKKALSWYCSHNHLYSSFYSNYETLFRYVKPQFGCINPEILAKANLSLEQILEDEVAGMAFPVDARFFDNYPLVFGKEDDVAGCQYPHEHSECQERMKELVTAHYGDKFLEPKTFPHLFPWGFGGWHYKCPMKFESHIKMKLYDVRGWWAHDSAYMFFKYDEMVKLRLRGYNSRRVVRVADLSEDLTAQKVLDAEKSTDPYAIYGTEVPRSIPGSRQHWKSFSLDLISFSEQRGPPDLFVTLSAYDCWPQVQSSLSRGWGSAPTEQEYKDVARDWADRQAVGWSPEVAVMAAEKRFEWIMKVILSRDGYGPFGIVEDYVWKKEYQKRGAVHWHMLLWCKPGTIPKHCIMAELPRSSDPNDSITAYLRKVVYKMQRHYRCVPERCLKGYGGKRLHTCKYGFPFAIPQTEECLDEEGIRYLYVRRHKEDALVVPYNPELCILWGASHNVQRVAKHGYEQYLAKYISKSEPSFNIDLPNNASDPQRYLRTRVIGSVEAIEVLMSFHQSQMTRQVLFLPTEIKPRQRMLRSKRDLQQLQDDSSDIYMSTRFDEYLHRPEHLKDMTYTEFFKWWRKSSTDENKKGEAQSEEGDVPHLRSRTTNDDFAEFVLAQQIKTDAINRLALALQAVRNEMIDDGVCVMILLRCIRYEGYSMTVHNEVTNFFESEGCSIIPDDYRPLSCEDIVFGGAMIGQVLLQDPKLLSDLESNHWLMATNPPGEALQHILTRYKPGEMLLDQQGRYWVRRAKMCITRYRFINPLGDEQDKFYEQKYLLNVPISYNDDIVVNRSQSWMQLCIMKGIFDEHADAMSSLQSALSRGFHVDSLRELARLYTEHGFITEDEADCFMAEVPTIGDSIDEPQAHVTDQLLGDPTDSDLGDLLPSRPSFDLSEYLKTFTESQYRAFNWIASQLDQGKQVQAAIIGPAGTGKSYLLQALIKQMRSQCLVVCKLAPSGVAAHLIGGTTVHNFFCLDLEYNSSLENGTFQTTRLRKTDVIVVDEFSMLDFYLFRTMEGLCRKFAKHGSSRHPWGGRHVILLGDPAQLPAVSGVDIFGTYLWYKFTVLLLREIKRATDPTLSMVLTKIREGTCDSHVSEVLQTRLQKQDINAVDLDKTVIICSTRAECDEINNQCLERISGPMCEYEADDSDNHGNGLRAADHQRIQQHRERLPDKLQLKVGARVILRRNIDIDAGWVNGTLAVVTALYQNCVVIQKMSNPSQRIPVPRFRQRIDINGASYSILRHQFPIQLAYAVTVHRIQGLTVQKAIIKIMSQFVILCFWASVCGFEPCAQVG